ncbi:hypothetical protein J32TS6_09120 [Virgibacillus pantothenticus]|uniref:Uncharacterized protein n=1 Tax=Virgibacillus pantothenticus TaxID=1473 RepID=A0A0L0QNW5_VIRPA|nr:hypothetical protein BKP57_18610 [Virgibacillus sp. 6R]KNE19938.1 hypothetical protein AFK71_16125 [Virgibacillus pantothenticus]GIP62357.1 hypothetical protein J32TS6_09120 [Virgibacillus pantothenticus]
MVRKGLGKKSFIELKIAKAPEPLNGDPGAFSLYESECSFLNSSLLKATNYVFERLFRGLLSCC